MNDKTKIVGTALGVIAIILSLVAISRPTPEKVIERTEVQKENNLGALTSPDIPYDYFSFGNVRKRAAHSSFLAYTSATSTACTFLSPVSTSTLLSAIGIVTDATSTAIQFEWGKGASPNATTTSLGTFNLSSGLQGVFVASTTPNSTVGIDPAFVIGPSQYVSLKFGGTILAANALNGYCNVTFEEIVY